jgi:putative ABC transport system substrate-binding protein
MLVIGFLNGASAVPFARFVAAFLQGLKDAGYIERQNLAIEYRWAEGQYDRLSALATELVRRPVAMIAATGGSLSAPR